jgi:hypothetical protein
MFSKGQQHSQSSAFRKVVKMPGAEKANAHNLIEIKNI